MKLLEEDKKRLVEAVSNGDHHATAAIVTHMSKSPHYSRRSQDYFAELATALKTDRWDKISKHWSEDGFIDDDGNVLLLADYTRRINGEDITQLTLLIGKICLYTPVRMEAAAIEIFGRLNQAIPTLVVLDVETAIGNIGGEDAFIAPGGWNLYA